MQGRPHGHLDGFQIQPAGLAPAGKDHAQKLVYFARDFLVDRFRRFFSCSVCGSGSTGRERQIWVLVWTNSRLSCWNLRNSLTSVSAFPIAAGVGNDSEIDLPFTL
jgi:hypothetical protein